MQSPQLHIDQTIDKLSRHYLPGQLNALLPIIKEIHRLKVEKDAVILAHNYMTPDIYHGVADIVGDSLKLAQEAAKTKARTIVQAGVHFMAETSKLLCPDKTVLLPDMNAGCSLAEGITADDVTGLRREYPGVPIVTYVNTSAAVKAVSDLCCTSGNALKIVEALKREGHKRVLMIPDKYLAINTAARTNVEILTYDGSCIVHELFSEKDIDRLRRENPDALILAHPECPRDVIEACDFAGSTAEMGSFIAKNKPAKAILVTECSMSDNIALEHPDVNLISGCRLCPYMKKVTLPKILHSLRTGDTEIEIDPAIAEGARTAVNKMLEMS